MNHVFSELLSAVNIPLDDVALLFHSFNNKDVCECYKKNILDEYQRLQCTSDKNGYFGNKGYIFSFIRDGHKNAFFYGCYINHGEILTKPDVSELTIKDYSEFIHPEWYDVIGEETPNGHGIQHYYRLVSNPCFSDLKNKLIICDISSERTVQYSEEIMFKKPIIIDDFRLEKKYFPTN